MQRPDFEQLVERFYEPLFRFACSLTKSEGDACDLTQQTFYLWASKGHQLRDASKVKSWLFTTLHREFLGSRRRETRFPHHSLDESAANLPTVSPTVVNALDSGVVMEALTEVDEVYRVPLSLFYMDQMSYQEIADTLKIPIGTVMSRLSRGKQQLRGLLAIKTQPAGRKVVPLPSHKQDGRRVNG